MGMRYVVLTLCAVFGGGSAGLSEVGVAQAASAAVVPAGLGISVSPQPGTVTANPDTQISFLGVPASSITRLVVQGSVSGRHSGRLASYVAASGASFLPARVGFAAGETVVVHANVLTNGATRPIAFSFKISRPFVIPPNPLGKARLPKPGQVQGFRSRPDLQPPTLTVTANSPGAAPGDIFLAPISGPGGHGPMIVDASGRLVFFHPTGKDMTMDFKVAQFQGRPVLTWWQGFISNLGVGFGIHQVLDNNYRHVASVQAGNGYLADLHDFQILPNGAALLTAYAPVRRNLASVHGASDGEVLDALTQEVDIKTGLVMFEWHALDHVGLTESYVAPPRTTFPYDYFHINTVSMDQDGSLLIAARNTWAGYEVSPLTGAIRWRLAGKLSSFSLGPGVRFSWEHDIRRQPDGTITVFDDGAAPRVENQSRGLVLNVDIAHHSATLARQYTHPVPLLAASQGNTQVLPNGNVFVGWGQVNYLSEFSPTGQLLFDATMPAPGESYRAFRYAWSATPPNRPNVKVLAVGSGKRTVYTSWNGATGVASWRVLGGSSQDPAQMVRVAESARTGFETALTVSTNAPHLAVQAIDAGGHVLNTTNAS